ncbi:hypothetical protein L1887_10665 [Cichorium endivia]|nr:hypothetical protein L1887_10665 [Cichorium endivia]
MYVVDSLCSFEEAKASHLYSYKHGFKGFAPKLSDDQALQISRIWPESPSFSDSDMPPGLAKWKGICQSGEAFNASNCNRCQVIMFTQKVLYSYEHAQSYQLGLGNEKMERTK